MPTLKLGKNCIINSKTLIEHDIFVGNHCHISTSATLNGGVHIGEQTFVGSGAVVRESIKIGSKCIISAGEVIMKDIPNNSKVKKLKKPVIIIAEIGVSHNGSLDIAKKLIDHAYQAGVDIVKFQTFK